MRKHLSPVTLIMLLLGMYACSPTAGREENNIAGQFINTPYGESLNLSKSKFVLVNKIDNHLGTFKCCDTITFGSYAREGNFLSFSTYPPRNFFELKVEDKITFSEDTLYFDISNVRQKLKQNINSTSEFNISVFAEMNAGTAIGNYNEQRLNQVIKLVKEPNKNIKFLSLSISINGDFQGRNIGARSLISTDVSITNPKSNYFVMETPTLNYSDFVYLRFKREFIKIIDKSHLEWNGKIFTRQ